MRSDLLRYGLAVVLYAVVGLFTKRFLTWTMGPLFFIAVLEVLPRLARRLRGGSPA